MFFMALEPRASAQRVHDTRPEPEVFFNTRSVPDLFSKSSGISGIGYFIKLCFWHGKCHWGATRYWLIYTYIIFIWLNWTVITSMYCGLIAMGISSITISFLCFHGFSKWKVISVTKLKQDYQQWRNSTGVYGNNLQGFKERCDQRIKILNIKVYF